MAIPTITAVTPGEVVSNSRAQVVITGTNFNLWPSLPVPNAGVLVYFVFGTEEFLADHIGVISDTEIRCQVVMYMGSESATAFTADVKVVNIDTSGDPVVGEEVTSVDAVTYVRDAHLSGDRGQLSFLERCFQEFMRMLDVTFHAEIALATHTDYHPEGTIVHFTTSYPAIGITNISAEQLPHTPYDPDFDREEGQEEEHLATEYFWIRCSLIPISDNAAEVHALWEAMVRYGQRVRQIHVPKGPAPSDRLTMEFRLDPAPDFGFTTNVGVAEATFSAKMGPVPIESPEVVNRVYELESAFVNAFNNLNLTGESRDITLFEP